MATLSISLPDYMKEYVDRRVAEEGYSTASDYFCDLIRDLIQAEQARAADGETESALEALLIEGLESGPPIEADEEYWRRKRADLITRHSKPSTTS